jgi:hypothetical protein
VPSHFGVGTKKDYLDAFGLQQDLYRAVREAVDEDRSRGAPPLHLDKGRLIVLFDRVYAKLKTRYGDWHGFDAQVPPSFINAYVATFVGE